MDRRLASSPVESRHGPSPETLNAVYSDDLSRRRQDLGSRDFCFQCGGLFRASCSSRSCRGYGRSGRCGRSSGRGGRRWSVLLNPSFDDWVRRGGVREIGMEEIERTLGAGSRSRGWSMRTLAAPERAPLARCHDAGNAACDLAAAGATAGSSASVETGGSSIVAGAMAAVAGGGAMTTSRTRLRGEAGARSRWELVRAAGRRNQTAR